jgi:hypothetical protein
MNRKLIKHVMRAVLVAVLIQFFAPVFIAEQARAETYSIHKNKETFPETTKSRQGLFINAHHNSFSIPVFFKELKESEEDEEGRNHEFLLPLILDLSHHSLVLTQTHECNATFFTKFDAHYDYHPPLFKLHCNFII